MSWISDFVYDQQIAKQKMVAGRRKLNKFCLFEQLQSIYKKFYQTHEGISAKKFQIIFWKFPSLSLKIALSKIIISPVQLAFQTNAQIYNRGPQ